MRCFSRLFALGVGLGLFALARPGDAAERTFTVEYTAANGCPGRDAFVDEIRRRTSIARVAGPGEQPEVSMRVRIDLRKRRAKGKLDITSGTTASQRELEDPSCAEVASALALVAALAIDPLAETAHLPPLPLPPDPHVPTDVGVRPAIPEPKLLEDPQYLGTTHAKVPREEDGYVLVPAALPAFPHSSPDRADRRAFEVGPGAVFALDVAVAPVPMYGVTGFLGFRSFQELPWSLRAELTYSMSAEDAVTEGSESDPASFRLLRGRVEGCLPGWTAQAWLRIWPCAVFGGGALWGEVRRPLAAFPGVDRRSEGTSPWVVGGLAGRAELAPTRWLAFELRAGPDFPLVRGSFKDDEGNELFAAPPITLSLGLGASLAF